MVETVCSSGDLQMVEIRLRVKQGRVLADPPE
jgi:hypothetical protein